MEREVGGGIGMGNTCKPMAVSFQYMTKSTTIKKKLKKIKIKKKISLEYGSGALTSYGSDATDWCEAGHATQLP